MVLCDGDGVMVPLRVAPRVRLGEEEEVGEKEVEEHAVKPGVVQAEGVKVFVTTGLKLRVGLPVIDRVTALLGVVEGLTVGVCDPDEKEDREN